MVTAASAIGASTLFKGAAIVGAAAIAGSATRSAAGKAAEAQRDAAAAIKDAALRGRDDVLKLFPQSQQALLTGAQGAFDILGQSIPLQQQQLSAGNLAAQQSVSQGFDQARAALLGLPTAQFGTQEVPFSTEPFLGGQSLFGEPSRTVFAGGQTLNTPTFGGLGLSGTPLPSLPTGQFTSTPRNTPGQVPDLHIFRGTKLGALGT